MFNRVHLAGHLGHAPEFRTMQNGKEVATLSLATNTLWKADNGGWKTQTEWHHITIFRQTTIDWIKKTLRKGDQVLIEGKLVYNKWEDKNGQKKCKAHILISDWDGGIQFIRSQKSLSNENSSEECSSKNSTKHQEEENEEPYAENSSSLESTKEEIFSNQNIPQTLPETTTHP